VLRHFFCFFDFPALADFSGLLDLGFVLHQRIALVKVWRSLASTRNVLLGFFFRQFIEYRSPFLKFLICSCFSGFELSHQNLL
jgi:hypothetical protein